MQDKLNEKAFYTLSSVGFSLISMGFTVHNNSIVGIAFGIVAFILGIKAMRIKK